MLISSKSVNKTPIAFFTLNIWRILKKFANCTKHNKLVASMLSLIHCFAAIAGSVREKTETDITRPTLNGYLSEIRF